MPSLLPIAAPPDRRLRRDVRTLVRFINFYCRHEHADAPKGSVSVEVPGLVELAGPRPELCAGCHKLLSHAVVKRMACPFKPKPACRHCPSHCYRPKYREQIRDVMRVAGRGLLWRGRIDYLLHLLF
jgi:hypothetical protein